MGRCSWAASGKDQLRHSRSRGQVHSVYVHWPNPDANTACAVVNADSDGDSDASRRDADSDASCGNSNLDADSDASCRNSNLGSDAERRAYT
jgi:hypothetical protein